MYVLTDFKSARPLYSSEQGASLDWLVNAYLTAREKRFGVSAEGSRGRDRMEKLLQRYGCAPPRIHTRYHEIRDFHHKQWEEMEIYRLKDNPHGTTLGNRMKVFQHGSLRGIRELYQSPEHPAPGEILHVTCTGYAAPNPAQVFAESRGWGRSTRVTPVYHSGCYAAVPALRLALALASDASVAGKRHANVDIVHTELCSLHLDPLAQEPDQLVVHSLFADGFIRYSLREWDRVSPAFRILAVGEEMVPNTQNEMQWLLEPYAFRMVLSRQVPEHLAQGVEGFVQKLLDRAGLEPGALKGMPYALHPGGPRILEVLQDKLRLDDSQIAHSRRVLAEHGNMSSATLPTLWQTILADPAVPRGARVLSLAFGPGLTLAGAILEKLK